ncbi:MAG: hypothetical protein M3492_03170 [Actinomycetota bacterium]|nr:hypothetical protein [Actinomycetota bacterium]
MSLEQELRATLRRAADDVGPAHPEAGMREVGMRALAHRRSRRRVTVLSAGLAVLLIGGGVPAGLSLLASGDNNVAAPEGPEPTPELTADPTLSVGIFDGPPRGSVADDADFLEGIRQLPWEVQEPIPSDSPQPAPPAESRRVVFAGDVREGRWALVVADFTGPLVTEEFTQAPEGTTGPADPAGDASVPPGGAPPTDPSAPPPPGPVLSAVWYAGVSGATPDQMQPVYGSVVNPDVSATLYDPTTGVLVVVAAPGDLIEVSARPEVAADGTVSRSFAYADTVDGVAVTALPPQPFGRGRAAAEFRVSRGDVVLEEGSPSSIYEREAPEASAIDLDVLRPSSGRLGEEERTRAQLLAAEILGFYGLRPDEADIRVAYSGPITSLTSAPADLIVVTVTFPSGAVVTRAQWFDKFSGSNASCGAQNGDMSPSGEPAERRILALRCDLDIQSEESSLIVLAPAELAEAMAVSDDATELLRLELDSEGVGIVDFPEGAASVAVFAADGTMVDEVPIFAF